MNERVAHAVVWATLGGMLMLATWWIATLGHDLPLSEDWLFVPALTGNEDNLLAWAWRQNAEHRVPLHKLLSLAFLTVTGGDFRTGMVVNTLVAAGIAAGAIVTMRRIRGRTVLADAAFPLLLLHFGHSQNLLWGWQFQFMLAAALTCALLFAMAWQSHPGPRQAAIMSVGLVLLPLTGANGVILALVIAPVLVYLSTRWTAGSLPPSPVRAYPRVVAAAALMSLIVAAVYFIDLAPADWNPPSPGLGATVWTAVRLGTMALGAGALDHLWWTIPFVFGIIAAALVHLARSLRPAAEPRTVALMAFLVASLALLAAMGWGRAGWVPRFGLPNRYAIFILPMLLAALMVLEVRGARWRTAALSAVGVAMLLLMPANIRHGRSFTDWLHEGVHLVLRDIRAGATAAELAERHHGYLLHWDREQMERGIRMLQDAGMGPFADLRPPSPGGQGHDRSPSP